jgi:hypothetical protein
MKDFSLIKQLNNPEEPILPTGIKYVEKTAVVEGEEVNVFIPLRESDRFDEAISEYGKYMYHHEFSKILRNCRGIRNRG